MTITIYHNPECGTSRNTLALIRNAGVEPNIIDYLKTPPTRGTLKDLIARAGLTVRGAIRERGTPYADLGLADAGLTDEQLLDLLLAPYRAAFAKEEGEQMILAASQAAVEEIYDSVTRADFSLPRL